MKKSPLKNTQKYIYIIGLLVAGLLLSWGISLLIPTSSIGVLVEPGTNLRKGLNEALRISDEMLVYESHDKQFYNVNIHEVEGGGYHAILMQNPDSSFTVLFQGQANPACSQVDPYNVPVSIVRYCHTENTNDMEIDRLSRSPFRK